MTGSASNPESRNCCARFPVRALHMTVP